jgi:hypothetical protein
MEKKTINIPQRLVISLLLGFVGSLIILIIIHRFANFSYAYKYSGPAIYSHSFSDPVERYELDCVLGGTHYFDGNGTSFLDLDDHTIVAYTSYLKASFDDHFIFLTLVGIIIGLIIYFSNRFNIKVVK